MASSSDCLLARAIPMPAKSKANNNNQVDKLAAQFDTMVTLEKKVEKGEVTGETKEQRRKRMEESISPADHLAFQSLRSSAMARKTNTTAKFSRDCRNLFADLLNLEDGNGNGNGKVKANGTAEKSEEAKKEVKANGEEAKDEKDKKREAEGNLKKKEGEGEGANCELIARGPIRANFIGQYVCQSPYYCTLFIHYFQCFPILPSLFRFVPHSGRKCQSASASIQRCCATIGCARPKQPESGCTQWLWL
jgi:hypothetical protein